MSTRRFYFICCAFTVLAMTVVVVDQRYGGLMVPLLAESRLKTGSDVKEMCRNRSCLWEREQGSRKIQLRDTCSAFRVEADTYSPPLIYQDNPNQLKMLSHLMVIHSHRLIYCFIPKVGCTSWKRLFLKLGNISDSMEAIGQRESHVMATRYFRSLASYPLPAARQLLATYTKFVFVRNPFERLLSAYQDKFQNDYPASREFRDAWSQKIIRFSAPSPTKLDNLLRTQRRKDGSLNVTFSQFARFVAAGNGARARKHSNSHWTSMYGLCHPCLVDYDWIGHYDSLLTDADFILTAAGVDPAVRFPNFTTNPTGSSDPSTLFRFYSSLTRYEIEAVYNHYSIDFGLFGFEIPTVIRNLLDRKHVRL